MYTVYGSVNCVACKQAVQLLQSKGLEVKLKMISYPSNLQELQTLIPGVKTVPQIFKNETYIGGYAELVEDVNNG